MKNRIGIVGGGQLARMLTFAAKQLGFRVTILDPTPNSPAGQVADLQIVGQLDDETSMEALAKASDFLTFDWELADPKLLEKMQQQGTPVNPSAKTLSLIKDKYVQKVFLQKAHIPVADFVEVNTLQDIKDAAKLFGYPLLLKAKLGAYDGKGNFLVKSASDITKGLEKLTTHNLYVEKFVPFEKELAVMVARSIAGDIKTFPVVETIHKNNILHFTLAPAPIDTAVTKKAQELAHKTMEQLKGAGVFGIEMFLTKDNQILINEIAPRVHNSGHYTIESCATSQFEQHIRAITGMPLGETTLIVPASVMINILGERAGKAHLTGLKKIKEFPNTTVHIYGKADTKIERKMGHITVTGTSIEKCLEIAKKARKLLSI